MLAQKKNSKNYLILWKEFSCFDGILYDSWMPCSGIKDARKYKYGWIKKKKNDGIEVFIKYKRKYYHYNESGIFNESRHFLPVKCYYKDLICESIEYGKKIAIFSKVYLKKKDYNEAIKFNKQCIPSLEKLKKTLF